MLVIQIEAQFHSSYPVVLGFAGLLCNPVNQSRGTNNLIHPTSNWLDSLPTYEIKDLVIELDPHFDFLVIINNDKLSTGLQIVITCPDLILGQLVEGDRITL